MKNIIITLLFSFAFALAMASSSNPVNEIQQVPVAEQVYNKLQVSSRLPKFIDKYTERASENRPEIPKNVWESAKNGINYTAFKSSVINVLTTNFSPAELQKMIDDYQNSSYIPILHLKVRNEIQLALQNFDSSIINQINNVLTSNGYQKLNK